MRHLVPFLTLLLSGMLAACTSEERKQEQMVNLEQVKDDPESQLRNLNAAIQMAKNDGSLYARRALVLLKDDKFEQALADTDEALRLTKDEPSTLFLKAQVLRKMNRQQEALKLALRAERNSYQSSALYVLLGELYFQQKKYKQAAAYISKAQQLTPADEYVLYYKARIQEATADTGRAIQNYKAALKYAPQFMEPKRELAGILVAQKAYEPAKVYLRAAQKQAPKDAQVLYYKGLLYEAEQKADSAHIFYRSAIAANDTLQGPHYKTGLYLYAQGDFEGAVLHLKKAQKSFGRTKKYLVTLANSYEKAGRNIEALDAYQKLLQAEPTYTYAYQAITRLKYKLNSIQPESRPVQPQPVDLIEN